MSKEISVLDLPEFKKLKLVFEKVQNNLEIIKQLSDECNNLLKSIEANEIVFQADIKKCGCENPMIVSERYIGENMPDDLKRYCLICHTIYD